MPTNESSTQKIETTPNERGERIEKEIGVTGTSNSGGIITDEEYNKDLEGLKGIEVFDQMRKADGTVQAALKAIYLPIMGVKWDVKSADDKDSQANELADFVKSNLFLEPVRSWRYTLRHFMLGLVYGRMPFEIVRKFLPDGKIGLHKIAPRLPKTIQKWEMEDGEEGITQMDPNGAGNISIPLDKLLITVNEMEGDNWDGISILRSAYKHWYLKDKLYTIDAMSHERHGLGIPIGKLPETATPEDGEAMKECLRNIRANEEAYIRVKGDWDIKMLGMDNSQRSDPFKSIQHHDRKILLSVLAQFLDLGEGKVGSFALSQDQSEFFILSLEAVCDDIIGEPINKYLIPKLIEWNFLNVPKEKYPKLTHSQIGRRDYDKFSSALQRFCQVKLLTPNVDTEIQIRDEMNLVPLSNKEIEERRRVEEEALNNPKQPEAPTKEIDNQDDTNTTPEEKGTPSDNVDEEEEEMADDEENIEAHAHNEKVTALSRDVEIKLENLILKGSNAIDTITKRQGN